MLCLRCYSSVILSFVYLWGLSPIAGFLTWIASPFIEAAAIEYAFQLGSIVYIGAGAMVLWATPVVEVYGPRVSRSVEFWIMVRFLIIAFESCFG